MKFPTQKRMVDPVGLGDAKFFADKERRRKRPQREQPLEGLKLTKPSEDDGVLEQLFTVHDSTTIPKPQGGRKLVVKGDAGGLRDLLKGPKHESESAAMMTTIEVVSMGLAAFTLILMAMIFVGNTQWEWPSFYLFWSVFLLHVCVFFGQCFAGGKNERLWISLGAVHLGWVVLGLAGALSATL